MHSSLSLSQQLVTRSGFGNYVLLLLVVIVFAVAPTAIPCLGFILGWFSLVRRDTRLQGPRPLAIVCRP